MSDGKKSCLGFAALVLGLGLAIVSILAGGVGQLVTALGGNSLGLNIKSGLIAGLVIFGILFFVAIYFFIRIKDYSWFPAIAAGIYAVVPDIIQGPQDDFIVMLGGVILSVIWEIFENRHERKMAAREDRPEPPPELPG